MEHSTRLIQLGSHLFYNTHAHVFEYPIIRNHNITQLSLASYIRRVTSDYSVVMYVYVGIVGWIYRTNIDPISILLVSLLF